MKKFGPLRPETWDMRNGKPTDKFLTRAIAVELARGYAKRNRMSYQRAATLIARTVLAGTAWTIEARNRT